MQRQSSQPQYCYPSSSSARESTSITATTATASTAATVAGELSVPMLRWMAVHQLTMKMQANGEPVDHELNIKELIKAQRKAGGKAKAPEVLEAMSRQQGKGI